jgi:hypothetical protein
MCVWGGCRPASSASPGSSWETQHLWTHPGQAEPESDFLHFNKILHHIPCTSSPPTVPTQVIPMHLTVWEAVPWLPVWHSQELGRQELLLLLAVSGFCACGPPLKCPSLFLVCLIPPWSLEHDWDKLQEVFPGTLTHLSPCHITCLPCAFLYHQTLGCSITWLLVNMISL